MKKTLFSVMWLAIAGVFTITALSACSDDDNENKSGSYVIQKNGVVSTCGAKEKAPGGAKAPPGGEGGQREGGTLSEMPLGRGGNPSPDFRIPLNRQTPDREEQSVSKLLSARTRKLGICSPLHS